MKIGFIGLGRMGRGMAARLAGTGHDLFVWNRTAGRAGDLSREHGAQAAGSPREVAARADLVFTMLADPAAVRQVAEGQNGILDGARQGLLWIDSSTIDPETTRDLAAQAEARGVRMLDAPVLGSVPEANSGNLLMVVGGDEKDLTEARPVMDVVAHKVYHIGGHGQGVQMKLVLNSLLAGFMEVTAEALELGLKGGIEKDSLQQVIAETQMASPWLKGKLTRAFDEQGPVNFSLPMMLKDLELIAANAGRSGAYVPALEATRAEYRAAAKDEDYRRRDYTDIFSYLLNKKSGVSNG